VLFLPEKEKVVEIFGKGKDNGRGAGFILYREK
jgi:hypothetical protein